MSKDITLLDEISEQDLHQVNGGTDSSLILYLAVSQDVLGDKGPLCTITKECMARCK